MSVRLGAGARDMVASAFFFSVMSLLVKLAGQRLPSQEIVLARSVASALLSLAMLRHVGVSPWGERRGLLVLRGTLGFIALSCFFFAVVRLPLADATVIQYTNPAFTALIAVWALGERMRAREVAAVATSLVGVALIARPSFLFGVGPGLPPVAAAVALLGAVLSGAAYVTVRRLGRTEHPLVIVFYFAMIGSIGSIPLAARDALWPTPVEWLLLAGVGGTTQLGQVFLTRGLRAEKAGPAMTIGYVQILFAAIWGVLFFGDVPGAWSVAGAALVVAGTLAVVRRPARVAHAP